MRECNTKVSEVDKQTQLVEWMSTHWEEIERVLPAELSVQAYQQRAMCRQREIRDAMTLLRMVLLYALGLSLRLVGAWGVVQGLFDLSAPAILKRLRHCDDWLSWLLDALLRTGQDALPACAGVRLCLVDATTVQAPGSQGTDWRLHLNWDLGSGKVDAVAVTSTQSGESLAHFASRPTDIYIADRGYAYASSLAPVLCRGSQLVVRINWQNLPLWTTQGQRLPLMAWLRQVPATATSAELQCELHTEAGRFPLRLIAGVLPQEAADRARQRARTNAQKKGRTVSPETLYACGFVLLVTNLPSDQWTTHQVLQLCRLRWQVEVLFRRWKGLLGLAELRTHDTHLAKTWLLGKLLLIMLCDALMHTLRGQMPDWFTSRSRPVSLWRLTALAYEHVRQLILGPLAWSQVLAHLPRLTHLLCDTPRRRQQQLATARVCLLDLSSIGASMLS